MIKHTIIHIRATVVCVPSDDYYARGNDWNKDEISHIEYIPQLYNTFEDAVKYLETETDLPKGEYMIVPVYIKE